ncbi:MAG TPA: ATP-binding cassette domain-containing protein [Chitinophagales bacterium]|nr:ATP-binding cassette domain-containing protein [Chitinophagales bacterium]
MTIILDNTGKRFGREWIFRKINYQFSSGKSYALLGPNGSGKSTLLQLLACHLSPTEGTVTYATGRQPLDADDVFRHISLCAPYMQLIEELTLDEQVAFHFNFKKPLNGISPDALIELLGLTEHADKQLRYFSSGMKQRVKFCLALMTDVPVLLLDEPATNLDENGVNWYKMLLSEYRKERLLIIASNRAEEHEMCGEKILLTDYK